MTKKQKRRRRRSALAQIERIWEFWHTDSYFQHAVRDPAHFPRWKVAKSPDEMIVYAPIPEIVR